MTHYRIPLIIIVTALLALAIGLMWHSFKQDSFNDGVASSFKRSCAVFEAMINEDGIYRYENADFGFNFTYPKDIVVCEQVGDLSDENKKSISIMLWKKDDFMQDNPRSGPVAQVDIDNKALGQLPASHTGKESDVDVDGVTATLKQMQSSLCIRTQCPVFTVINFQRQGHDYAISSMDSSLQLEKNFHWLR